MQAAGFCLSDIEFILILLPQIVARLDKPLIVRLYLQHIVQLAHQMLIIAAHVGVFRHRPKGFVAAADAVRQTKLDGVVQLLPQFSLVIGGDGHLFVDGQSRHRLPRGGGDKVGFALVDGKPHFLQPVLHLYVHVVQRDVGGEGQIVAIAGVGDAVLLAPAADGVVKVAHHDVGQGRGGGCALGQHLLVAAQAGEHRADLGRVQGGGEGGGDHLQVGDAAEKVGDVHLQQILVSHVGRGVVRQILASDVGGGIGGHRQMGQDAALDALLGVLHL